jgi:hypothetical protein
MDVNECKQRNGGGCLWMLMIHLIYSCLKCVQGAENQILRHETLIFVLFSQVDLHPLSDGS